MSGKFAEFAQMYGVEDTDKLFFATAANKVGKGLNEQLEGFLREHPDTKLIIIDTMQKIREVGGEAYSYASDYEIIGALKQFADRYNICILTVHHTRKQPSGDSFEMISGTTGLLEQLPKEDADDRRAADAEEKAHRAGSCHRRCRTRSAGIP